MQLPESIETYGYFWLAEKPDNRLTGVLRISARGEASLETFGAFDADHAIHPQQLMGEKLHIQGVTDKEGPVTLVDCLVTHLTAIGIDEQLFKSSLRVERVFCGAHFDSGEVCFSGMTFAVEGLDEWFSFHHRPFSHEMDPAGQMSFTYSPPESITFQLPDDLSIGFHMGARTSLGLFQATITTKMGISVESSRMRAFSDFMQVLQKIKNFLCLVFDRSVSFTSITGSRRELNAPHTAHDKVVIYGRFDPYDLRKENISAGNFLISFHEMADNIHEYLPRWLERYEEYEPTFNLYFAVTANRFMHLEGGFLFLVHGIESLHRRSSSETKMPVEEFNSRVDSIVQSTPEPWKSWVREKLGYANALSLRNRIKQMIAPFDNLFGSDSERAAFVNRVVFTRNYLTHYDEGIKERAVTDAGELRRLRSKLEALVQLHLLLLLEIDHDRIWQMAMRYPLLRNRLGL